MAEKQKLGEFSLRLTKFPNLEEILDEVERRDFFSLSLKEREEKVHQLLLQLIQKEKTPCFLLGAVSEFIRSILDRKWISSYLFSHFEFWLNQFSGLKEHENYEIRAKIMGRYVPREAYQAMFPVGMGKVHVGSHYVTAHGSPDLDTTVASFWGWVDAFSARVGDGMHLWNVPGGPPESQVEVQSLFQQFLGGHFFDCFSKNRTSLALSAMDLASYKGVVEKEGAQSVQQISDEGRGCAVVLVDADGYYVGDWRGVDGEVVREVTTLLNNCLRWFGSRFQQGITDLFAQSSLAKAQVQDWMDNLFSFSLEDAEPVKDSTEKQQIRLDAYLVDVLGVKNGKKSSFSQFWEGMEGLSLHSFGEFRDSIETFFSLFDAKGVLQENRAAIFSSFSSAVERLEKAIQSIRKYVDNLGIAFSIKHKVYQETSQSISHRAEVEEIRSRLGGLSYLTVTEAHPNGKEKVLGVVKATAMNKGLLGTVSLRDFCNRDETKIPSYFEVISVIDHHKSVLNTGSSPVALIADSQSVNSLVAELSFAINDCYGVGNSSLTSVEQQLVQTEQGRIAQRLWQKRMILQKKHPYFVDPQREFLEYLHYLYAILDDTDLLSKVSYRDVLCVASLLNRMKTIVVGKEVEVIAFDDLPLEETFVSKAAKRILQNEEMYSLYRKIYESKEKVVSHNLYLCAKKEPNTIFADTKEQNGCSRVGQTKLFVNNFADYHLHVRDIRSLWQEEAQKIYAEKKDCDLHMHMISTVPSAENVYSGEEGAYKHQDELWIWIPQTEQSVEHLKVFLTSFQQSPVVASAPMEVEFLGEKSALLEQVFHESFKPITKKESYEDSKKSASIAIVRYRAGLLNSRKAMISPYLPKLVD